MSKEEMNHSIREMCDKISKVYTDAFGRTPLRQRIEDILGEANELGRYTDLKNMKEEAGDLLTSLISLFNENDWSVWEAVEANLAKIQSRVVQYKTMGRKTKVAILGGAFNPVTIGHIQVAQFVLNTSKTFDEVWLTPCYNHLYNKLMVGSEYRLAMCRLAAEVDARIKVFPYEIDNELKGETYNFVKRLLEEDFAKNQYDFSMIIGLDNANTFDKWVNYQDLERMIRFVVVPRQGIMPDPKVNWYLQSPHIFLTAEKPIIECSSTYVRQLLEEDDESNVHYTKLHTVLDDKVLQYILDKRLYDVSVK
jgi:nicotinate-nucleotide adenylyltransferase